MGGHFINSAVLIESDFLNEFPKVGGGRTIKLFKLINEV